MAGSAFQPAFALMWLVGAACAIGAATQAKYHRLAALSLAGGAGLATAMTFVWFSAPDLALTQLVVEVVTVVLILLGLRWLPPRYAWIDDALDPFGARVRARSRRLRDLALASIAGASLAMLSYAVLTRQAGEGISHFFIENSLPLGGGANVINVILVDFRGFDTLGEITVVGIVALTVFALLRRFRPAPESMEPPSQQREQDAHAGMAAPDPHAPLPPGPMMVPGTLVQLLLPVAGMVSVFFLLRGHNEPGGGFVGGLIMATAIILQYLVGGTAWAESRTRIRPQYWIGAGLLCAAGAGISAWVATRPFLSALAWHETLPVIGELHLSTVLLFDLGVYFLVIGSTVLILVALAHQSLRAHRKSAAQARPEAATDGVAALPAPAGPEGLMEIVYALAIGVLTGSGVWLLLRPRTFQVIMGLSLLSYAVNLFIFGMGRLAVHLPPIITTLDPDPSRFDDPVPQALVLTAIVISFATTALFLVVLLASRGLTGTDHVDGEEEPEP